LSRKKGKAASVQVGKKGGRTQVLCRTKEATIKTGEKKEDTVWCVLPGRRRTSSLPCHGEKRGNQERAVRVL